MARTAKSVPKRHHKPTAKRASGPAQSGDARLSPRRIEGRIKAKANKKIGELIEGHPDEALSILRNWLNEKH